MRGVSIKTQLSSDLRKGQDTRSTCQLADILAIELGKVTLVYGFNVTRQVQALGANHQLSSPPPPGAQPTHTGVLMEGRSAFESIGFEGPERDRRF